MRVLLLAAALRHASRTAHGLSLAAQHRRRVLRGVLRQELEGQHRARINLEAELERRRDVDGDDGEEYAKEYAKAVRRAAAVPRRLVEVTRRGEQLEALLARSRGATEDEVNNLYQEVADELADKLETFDVDAAARDQFGRPTDFDGLVMASPRGVPVLVARRSFSDELLRRVGRGTDLWFQCVEGRGSRVLLRTSCVPSLSKSPRECMEFAADLAAYFGGGARGGDDAVEVMYTDSRRVAKRGSRVGQLKPKKRLGTVWARPGRVADAAREAQEDQGWL